MVRGVVSREGGGEEGGERDRIAVVLPAPPAAVLQAAAGAVRAKGLKGSATACIVTVDVSRGLLKCTNLGDSGFLILRSDPATLEVPPLPRFWRAGYTLPCSRAYKSGRLEGGGAQTRQFVWN